MSSLNLQSSWSSWKEWSNPQQETIQSVIFVFLCDSTVICGKLETDLDAADRNNGTTLQESVEYCSWMFLYFSTISCIVVNTVCNYFWCPCIQNLCKCIQITYISIEPHSVPVWLLQISTLCLFPTKSYLCKCHSQFTNLLTERLILFSWAEKCMCAQCRTYPWVNIVFTPGSGRLIILLEQCTGSSLYTVHFCMFKIPSGLFIPPLWNACTFLKEKPV